MQQKRIFRKKATLILLSLLLVLVLLNACKDNVEIYDKREPSATEKHLALKENSFDLIVVGGEPEGVAAAVAAARSGVNTLLIEDVDILGGLMTRGWLNFLDMNYGPQKELLTRGIFEEFYNELGNAFDIAEASKYFKQIVEKEESITLKLNTQMIAPIKEGNAVVGVKVLEDGQEREYKAKRIIDATVDADLAVLAGVPYTIGGEDYGREDSMMAVTLVFKVKNINWPLVFIHNNWNRLISKINSKWGDPNAGATWKVAWGYGAEALKYEPHDKMMRFRGPNLARQDNGDILINALLIFGVDGADPSSRVQGIRRGEKELTYVLQYMRDTFAGFRKAQLAETAPELYVRETRHIEGEYRLTITDVLENRDQWDRIAHGSYPVDIQSSSPGDLGNVIGKPAIYSIPFRSLVPLEIDNLLVVGRSASYDSLAHGSARVIPVGMAAGQAAGTAVKYSLDENMGFRQMTKSREAIAWLQEELKSQGSYLVEYDPPQSEVMKHWAYPGVRLMRELGVAAGGYNNDYRLEEPANYWDVRYAFAGVIQNTLRQKSDIIYQEEALQAEFWQRNLPTALAEALTGNNLPPEQAIEYLLEKEVITKELAERLGEANKDKVTFAELYMVMSGLYQSLLN